MKIVYESLYLSFPSSKTQAVKSARILSRKTRWWRHTASINDNLFKANFYQRWNVRATVIEAPKYFDCCWNRKRAERCNAKDELSWWLRTENREWRSHPGQQARGNGNSKVWKGRRMTVRCRVLPGPVLASVSVLWKEQRLSNICSAFSQQCLAR